MTINKQICVSIVSHGQITMILPLLADLAKYSADNIEVILTINIPEQIPAAVNNCPFPLTIIHNPQPKGFASNHNSAFQQCKSQYYCVLNPDIRLHADPFAPLLTQLTDDKTGLVAAVMIDEVGNIQDSARKFPTVLSIARRVLTKERVSDYFLENKPIAVDWVAGMFMLFRSTIYRQLDGFDERYFLYYEDVDLCARLSASGYHIIINPQVRVVHNAQRRSHRNLRFLKWHISGMLRYFFRYYLTNLYKKSAA